MTIEVGVAKRSVRPEQAQALLDLLRGLPYGPTFALPKRISTQADVVVELTGQERWVIASDQVVHQVLAPRAKGAMKLALEPMP